MVLGNELPAYWEIVFQQQGHECASSMTKCTRVFISRKTTQYLVSGLAVGVRIIGRCNHRTSTSLTSYVEVHEGSVYECKENVREDLFGRTVGEGTRINRRDIFRLVTRSVVRRANVPGS